MKVELWIQLMMTWRNLPASEWREKIIRSAPSKPAEWHRWDEARKNVMLTHRLATDAEKREWVPEFGKLPPEPTKVDRCPDTIYMFGGE